LDSIYFIIKFLQQRKTFTLNFKALIIFIFLFLFIIHFYAFVLKNKTLIDIFLCSCLKLNKTYRKESQTISSYKSLKNFRW